MPRSISASVGRMGGVNRPPDVKTVQDLLNQVPAASGGPAPPLVPDGLCGKKTIDAIQRFQLHHFGWKGADGRVDPAGPTIAKLNEFDRAQARALRIRNVEPRGRFLDPNRSAQWFFEVAEGIRPDVRAVYHLRGFQETTPFPIPGVFLGESVEFKTTRPVSDLVTRGASYQTHYRVGTDPGEIGPDQVRPDFSRLLLLFLAASPSVGQPSPGIERLEIVSPAHIQPPPLARGPFEQLGPRAVRSKGDSFVRVRP